MQVCPPLRNFPPGQPRGRLREVGRGVEQHRRLAAEFEGHRGQVAGRRGHHDPADARAAGEEDVVERKFEQRGREVLVPLDHRDLLRRKGLTHHPPDEFGRAGRHLRRLQDDAVAGRHRGDQRRQGQIEGVVPGPDDEDLPFRFPMNPAVRPEQHERRRDPLRPHPPPQVAHRVIDLPHRREVLGQIGLHLRLPEIRPQRRAKILEMPGHRPAETPEPLDALRGPGPSHRRESLRLPVEKRSQRDAVRIAHARPEWSDPGRAVDKVRRGARTSRSAGHRGRGMLPSRADRAIRAPRRKGSAG
jgi:hypothetical protein